MGRSLCSKCMHSSDSDKYASVTKRANQTRDNCQQFRRKELGSPPESKKAHDWDLQEPRCMRPHTGGDCAAPTDMLLLRRAALDLNTSLHSIPTSLTPGTPASSQLRRAGSHVPQSESARARWSAAAAAVVVAAAVGCGGEAEEGSSSDRRMIGSARRAERCNTGENGIVGSGGGAEEGEEGDSVAEEVERCRVAELEGGLVACVSSDRDDRLRCVCGFGVLSTSAAAPSASSVILPLEFVGSRRAAEAP